MSEPDQSAQRVEATMAQITDQIDNDPDFRGRLSADPAATLLAAGVSQEVAQRARVVSGDDPTPDVSGYTVWESRWQQYCWVNSDGSKECVFW